MIFFFTASPPTDIYTLSLHDALPISFFPGVVREVVGIVGDVKFDSLDETRPVATIYVAGSEEHTSELQSHSDLVCRLLLEKKRRSLTAASLRSSPSTSNPTRERRRNR